MASLYRMRKENTMKIKFLALLLSALMLLSCFAGCNEKQQKEVTEVGTDPTVTEEETVPDRTFADLARVDLQEEEFTILTRSDSNTNLWKPIDWMGTAEDTDDIPAAVFKRNTRVEETFNCTIKHVMDTAYLEEAQAAFMGDTEDYDIIVMPVIQQLGNMAASGYYADLSALSTLNLQDCWWDQKTNSSLSLLNHYYTLCGDIDVTDNRATWCVFFNKVMESDYSLFNHYDAVENGTWTMETMFANAAEVDNENLGLTGIGTELFAYSAFLMGSGVRCFVKNEEDVPMNRMNNREVLEAVNSIYSYVQKKDLQMYGDDPVRYPELEGTNFGVLYKTFKNASMLYCMGTLSNAVDPQISDASFSYGILPVPKLSSAVSEYVSTFQGSNGTGVSILSNHDKKSDIGIVLEALSAASVDTLTPAFYDTTLMGRKVPDPDSSEMLDIILNNREVDLGIVLSQQVRGILNDTFMTMSSFTFANNRASYMQNLETNLEKIITDIRNNFVAQQ